MMMLSTRTHSKMGAFGKDESMGDGDAIDEDTCEGGANNKDYRVCLV